MTPLPQEIIQTKRDGGVLDEASIKRFVAGIVDGRAAERFQSMISAPGGPNDLLEQYREILPRAPVVVDAAPAGAGFIAEMDVYQVGMTVVELGGGRTRSDQGIDLAVGLENVAGIGERVDNHRPIARIHARSREEAERAAARLSGAVRLSDGPVDAPPAIHRAVGSSPSRPASEALPS